MSVSIEAATESGRRAQAPPRIDRRPYAWWVHWVIDAALGFVLVHSALAHLANPYFFLSSIYDYKLVGLRVGAAVALFLPHLELVVGVSLILGICRRAAILLAAPMFLGFFVVQSIAWLRGLSISCGCFGPSGSETIGLGTISFVLVLAALAGASAAASPK